MDIRKVKKLIELLEESNIDELEIHEGEESVRISRHSSTPALHSSLYAAAPAPAPAPAPAAAEEEAPACPRYTGTVHAHPWSVRSIAPAHPPQKALLKWVKQ